MALDNWTVLCDFDGTIALTDVIDSLLERYGRDGWRELEQDWLAGRIGSRECMQRQVALLDLDADTLNAHLDDIEIDPAFPAFLRQAAALGYQVGIVSDGMDYAIHRILRRHDLTDLPIAANRLLPGSEVRQWRLASPFEAEGCGSGTCKCAQIRSSAPQVRHGVLLIGDGTSDFCAAGTATHTFAKGKLRVHCEAKGLPHTGIAGFADAIELLPRLARIAA
jgi:2,3-diketo-5-methylthio-1-phosphopentane phosphatase